MWPRVTHAIRQRASSRRDIARVLWAYAELEIGAARECLEEIAEWVDDGAIGVGPASYVYWKERERG